MTVDMETRDAIRSVLENILKPEQVCLLHILNGGDVVALLPTGFGKSFIYQLLPIISEKQVSVSFLFQSLSIAMSYSNLQHIRQTRNELCLTVLILTLTVGCKYFLVCLYCQISLDALIVPWV